MSEEKMNGRKIKYISWPGVNESMTKDSIGGIEMEWLNTFHGEYDVDWVIVKRDGKEIQRHTARNLDTIIWDDGA